MNILNMNYEFLLEYNLYLECTINQVCIDITNEYQNYHSFVQDQRSLSQKAPGVALLYCIDSAGSNRIATDGTRCGTRIL